MSEFVDDEAMEDETATQDIGMFATQAVDDNISESGEEEKDIAIKSDDNDVVEDNEDDNHNVVEKEESTDDNDKNIDEANDESDAKSMNEDDDNDIDKADDNENASDDENDNLEESPDDETRKRDRSKRYELEREDIHLMEENLGLANYEEGAPQRKRLRKRAALQEEEGATSTAKAESAAELAARLFGEDDDDDDMSGNDGDTQTADAQAALDVEIDFDADSDEDDLNNFVVTRVDERGEAIDEPRRKKKKRRQSGLGANMEQLMEAQRIFGNDDDMQEYARRGQVDLDDELGDGGMGDEYTKVQQHVERSFEPAILKAKQMTAKDAALRRCAAPERYAQRYELQLSAKEAETMVDSSMAAELLTPREVPTDKDLEHEAGWIWRRDGRLRPLFANQAVASEQTMLARIMRVLELLQRQLCEVPFIAQYRKEQWQPELKREHLWIIAEEDHKWFTLQRQRVKLLTHTFEVSARAQQLVDAALAASDDEADTEDVKDLKPLVDDEGNVIDDGKARSLAREAAKRRRQTLRDAARAEYATADAVGKLLQGEYSPNAAISQEEMNDVGRYCALQQCRRDTLTELAAQAAEHAAAEVTGERPAYVRHESNLRRGFAGMDLEQYRRALRLRFSPLAAAFGMSARQLGENVTKNFSEHSPDDPELMPEELAQDYVSDAAELPEDALLIARTLLVEEIAAEPAVRRAIRGVFPSCVTISTSPTELGDDEITPFHEFASVKALVGKRLHAFNGNASYLLLKKAVDEGYITLSMDVQEDYVMQRIEALYLSDRNSSLARAWNAQRRLVLESALRTRLFPQLQAEIDSQLTEAAQLVVVDQVRGSVRAKLEAGPYKRQPASDVYGHNDNNDGNDEDDLDDPERTVMALVWGSRDIPTMCCVLNRDGTLIDSLQLHHMYRIKTVLVGEEGQRSTAPQDQVREQQKQQDCMKLSGLVLTHRPAVIGVGAMASKLESRNLLADLWDIVNELYRMEKIERAIDVHYVDGAAAIEYARTKRAGKEFPDQHAVMLQAISIGRRLLDPLCELAALLTPIDAPDSAPLANLHWHPLQHQLPPTQLHRALEMEVCDAVCRVGVDLHRTIFHSHAQHLLQFVAGLGPRKARAMITIIQRECGSRVNSRIAVNVGRGGRSLEEDEQDEEMRRNLEFVCQQLGGPNIWRNCCAFLRITERYVDSDILDPLDSTRVHPDDYAIARKIAGDATDQSAAEERRELLEVCRRLLNDPAPLDDVDLGAFATELARRGVHKSAVLDDIRREFRSPFQDPRSPYEYPSNRDVFFMLTGETPESMMRGTLLSVKVLYPTKARVRVMLDCGVDGLIEHHALSDTQVDDCADVVNRGQVLQARIVEVDFMESLVRLACSATMLSNSGPLVQERIHELSVKDYALDVQRAFDVRAVKERIAARKKERNHDDDDHGLPVSMNRLIVHPLFKNVTFERAERILCDEEHEIGDVLFRPSSKGYDFIAMTWRFWSHSKDVFVHFGIHEKGKEKLEGADKLKLASELQLEGETYSDLNEIVARFIEPMNELARNMVEFDKFGDKTAEEAGEWLNDAKRKAPESIPYIIIVSQQYPGRFVLMYHPRTHKIKRELITLSPNGYRLRHKVFGTPRRLVNWFKGNWHRPLKVKRQPLPSSAPSSSSQASSSSSSSRQPRMNPARAAMMAGSSSSSSRHNGGGRQSYPQRQAAPPMQYNTNTNNNTSNRYSSSRSQPQQFSQQQHHQQQSYGSGSGGGWASGGWSAPPR